MSVNTNNSPSQDYTTNLDDHSNHNNNNNDNNNNKSNQVMKNVLLQLIDKTTYQMLQIIYLRVFYDILYIASP